MNLICKLGGHKSVYQFVAYGMLVTVPNGVGKTAVVSFARLADAVTSVTEVCTRCGVIVWEGPRPSDVLSQDQEGSPSPAHQSDPVNPSTAISEPGNGINCTAWVRRSGELVACRAVLLPEGGCGNAHRHLPKYEGVKEGDLCIQWEKTFVEVTPIDVVEPQYLPSRKPCQGTLVWVGDDLVCSNERNHYG